MPSATVPAADASIALGMDARDEKGSLLRVPLTTLSLAGISSRALGEERHPAAFSQLAAGLRRTAKTVTAALGRSGFALHEGTLA